MSEQKLVRFVLRLLLWTLLFSCGTSMPVQVHRRQRTTDNTKHPSTCVRTSGTCGYYNGCLERQFKCGATGFILQYAKERCEAARKLASCNDCIRNENLVRWSNNVEACIQTGLQNLIDVDFRGVKPDPVTCTRFEQKAIEKVDDCYRYPEGRSSYDLPELCTLLGNSISEQLHKDLSRLVKDFSVEGDYHVSMVDLGIPEVVRECGHPEVADSLYIGEPRLRVIFCTWGYDKRHPNVRSLDRDSYVTFLSRHFNDSESRFQYGGSGLSRLCAEKAPDSASYNIDSIYDIHVVTWFALPNNTVAKDWNVTKVTHNGADGDIFVRAFFEFTYDRTEYLANRIRDYRKCGNGRRDPGEMCDYAMLNSSACSLECEIEQPTEESEGVYECTTDRLSPSYCWLQRCGDGRKASTEECDDNNLNNGDGCSSQCRIERPQFKCSQTYNETSYCEPRSPVIGTQRQMTRNIVHAKLTDSAPPRTTVDVPLDSSGLSFARRLVSRTGLVLLMVLATLWTILTLA